MSKLLQWGMDNSSSQDFWTNFVYFLPKIAKYGEIWPNSSSQKIPGLMSYTSL